MPAGVAQGTLGKDLRLDYYDPKINPLAVIAHHCDAHGTFRCDKCLREKKTDPQGSPAAFNYWARAEHNEIQKKAARERREAEQYQQGGYPWHNAPASSSSRRPEGKGKGAAPGAQPPWLQEADFYSFSSGTHPEGKGKGKRGQRDDYDRPAKGQGKDSGPPKGKGKSKSRKW